VTGATSEIYPLRQKSDKALASIAGATSSESTRNRDIRTGGGLRIDERTFKTERSGLSLQSTSPYKKTQILPAFDRALFKGSIKGMSNADL
jgi:hypothetical protein